MAPNVHVGSIGTHPPRRCAQERDPILPYGLFDAAVGIAIVSLSALVDQLQASGRRELR